MKKVHFNFGGNLKKGDWSKNRKKFIFTLGEIEKKAIGQKMGKSSFLLWGKFKKSHWSINGKKLIFTLGEI